MPLRVASVFRYGDVQAVLRDDETWSNRMPMEERIQELPDVELPPPSMLGTDGAEHPRLRGLVNKAFTPRIVQRLEPRMHEIAEGLVARAVEAREVDLVEALTYPLPFTIIAEMIGIPAGDRARFKE